MVSGHGGGGIAGPKAKRDGETGLLCAGGAGLEQKEITNTHFRIPTDTFMG
jgi:hypothetical protein